MQQLSNDLLSLWSGAQTAHSKEAWENVDLKKELNEVRSEFNKAFACTQRFRINTPQENCKPTVVRVFRPHLRLLLNNVCKNAIVHSDSLIDIFIEKQQVTISNAKNQKAIDLLVAGSGIGLIIATRAADLLGWSMIIDETDAEYKICLKFSQVA